MSMQNRRMFVTVALLAGLLGSAQGDGSEGAAADAAKAGAAFKKASAWSAFNAGSVDGLSTKGYFGEVFDGRYVYFVPCREREFHGRMLRYDTKGEFKAASSWAAYDAGNTDGLTTLGYAGGVYDGRYVYYVPFSTSKFRHGRVLRYDPKGDFKDASSWSAYDAGFTDRLHTKGYTGGVTDGRYLYFAPFGYTPFGHGRVLRYDTQGGFKKASSWSGYDAGSTDGLNTRGYYGLAFDGRYVYFVPFHDGKSFHGRMLRYDTKGEFKAETSWTAYDAGGTGGLDTRGYKMAVFDGRYVFFIPFRSGEFCHCHVLRYDTKGEFKAASSWTAYDAGSTDGLTTKGYVGAAFDKRFLYLVPYSGDEMNFHGAVLRYDSAGDFKAASSWSAYDAGATDGLRTRGYKGEAFDGRYIYFAPYHNGSSFHGAVLRFDTTGR